VSNTATHDDDDDLGSSVSICISCAPFPVPSRARPRSGRRGSFEFAFPCADLRASGMAGRVRADETVRVKGSNPSWLDRDREKRDGRAAEVATKVSRYRAGVLPEWAAGEAGGDDRNDPLEDDIAPPASSARPGRGRIAAPAVIVSRSGPAEAGLARAVKPPAIVKRGPAASEEESTASEEEEDEDEIARRRAAARARLVARRREEEEELMPVEDEDEEEDERKPSDARKVESAAASGSSSWETDTDNSDSEDEIGGGVKIIKPVFVTKAQRETIAERDRLEAEADDDWARRREARVQKKTEASRFLVELEIAKEKATERALENAEGSDVETDDALEDPDIAYRAWRSRELARIKEDEDAREKMFAEREEREKIRRMTEDERKSYFSERPEVLRRCFGIDGTDGTGTSASKPEKPKLGFMQRYYHKGAFFQEAADDRFGTAETHEIYKRDFSEATGGDKGVDKSSLPKAMRVRGDAFGKVGQTKWTHLANEDTSARFADDQPLWVREKGKKGKQEQSFEKPRRI